MANGIIRRMLFSALLVNTITAFAGDPSTYFDRAILYSANDNSSATIFLDVNDVELRTATLIKFRHDKEGRDEEYEFEIPSTIEMHGEIYTITEIGEKAFLYLIGDDNVVNDNLTNDNLTKIILPESIEEIGKEAFSWCYTLKTLTLPNKIAVIPEKMCRECESLENVYIGENVVQIESDAFFPCSKLSEVYIMAPKPPVNNYAFPLTVKTVYVPVGSLDDYKAAWNKDDLKDAEFKEYDGFGTPSGIQEVDDDGISVSSGEGVIRISGNYDNLKISVYGISGQKVVESSDAEISVSLPRGIYVVRTENANIKIIN